jgi:hypothetical protein
MILFIPIAVTHNMQASPHLLRALPYAGALPFIACVLLPVLGITDVPLLGNTKTIALTYGLTIVSFMAGVHWGQVLSGVKSNINLLVSSNAVVLAAWFGFLLLPPHYYSALLIVLFVALYGIDRQLHPKSDYLKTRRNVTALVCFSLLIAAFA